MTPAPRTMNPTSPTTDRTIALDEVATTAVTVLLRGLMLYGTERSSAPERHAPVAFPFDPDFHEAVRELARLILRRARDGSGVDDGQVAAVADVVLRMTADAESTTAREGWVTDPAHFTAGDAMRSVSHLLEYMALEEFDAAVYLEPNDGTEWSLHWRPLTTEAAHMGLLESMYLALDRRSLEHPLVAFERAACLWWFSRNGITSPATGDGARAWKMREHEWSLADRNTTSTGKTILAMAREVGFEDGLGPRSRRMVHAADASLTGIFVVREQSGEEFTVEDLVRRERLTLREHDRDRPPHAPGTLIVGRLYPFGPKRYLRSPGALVFGPRAVATADILDKAGTFVRAGVPLAVAIESAVAMVVEPGVRLPRDVPAFASPAEAQEQLDALESS